MGRYLRGVFVADNWKAMIEKIKLMVKMVDDYLNVHSNTIIRTLEHDFEQFQATLRTVKKKFEVRVSLDVVCVSTTSTPSRDRIRFLVQHFTPHGGWTIQNV